MKVPRVPEVTRTFRSERNARVAYLMAQHGVADFTTPLGDIGPRIWPEPKNLTALSHLAAAPPSSGPRMNSGDSDADSASDRPAAPAPHPYREDLPREPPISELVAEDAATPVAVLCRQGRP